jgi:hypothetical protein
MNENDDDFGDFEEACYGVNSSTPTATERNSPVKNSDNAESLPSCSYPISPVLNSDTELNLKEFDDPNFWSELDFTQPFSLIENNGVCDLFSHFCSPSDADQLDEFSKRFELHCMWHIKFTN